MDRVRPAMLIAALVVDVGRRLPRRCGSAVPPSARMIRVYVRCSRARSLSIGAMILSSGYDSPSLGGREI